MSWETIIRSQCRREPSVQLQPIVSAAVRIYDDMGLATGNTPLVRLARLTKGLGGIIAGKIEYRNPARSLKCRLGAALMWEGIKSGKLRPGMTVVESTTGNTGIALAQACARLGYGLMLTMPESASTERRKVLRALGARVILSPSCEGVQGAAARARAIAVSDPNCYYPDQYSSPANPNIHYQTTGPEIWIDTEGKVSAVVAGIGTGGTITGTGRFLKKRNPNVRMIGVEPASCSVLTGGAIGPTKIQGLGTGFVPKVLDMSVVDEIACVTDEEAMEWTRRLAAEEGLFCGISSGAAAAVAARVAARPEYDGKYIVCILPDSGELYLSSAVFAL